MFDYYLIKQQPAYNIDEQVSMGMLLVFQRNESETATV